MSCRSSYSLLLHYAYYCINDTTAFILLEYTYYISILVQYYSLHTQTTISILLYLSITLFISILLLLYSLHKQQLYIHFTVFINKNCIHRTTVFILQLYCIFYSSKVLYSPHTRLLCVFVYSSSYYCLHHNSYDCCVIIHNNG